MRTWVFIVTSWMLVGCGNEEAGTKESFDNQNESKPERMRLPTKKTGVGERNKPGEQKIGESGKKPKPLSKNVVMAWWKAEFKAGWMGPDSALGNLRFSTRLEGLDAARALPAFRTHSWRSGVLESQPLPTRAFGLSLGGMEMADVGLKELKKLGHLTSLAMPNTLVSDVGLKELAKLSQLITLDLSSNLVTDTGLKELAKLSQLTDLNLSNNRITDLGMKELAKLSRLARLDLMGTQVTDAGLKELAKLTQLAALILGNTQVTDKGLKELVGLKQLAILNLSNTQVTDAGLEELAKLDLLTRLVLSETKVTDAGLEELTKLNQLTTLILGFTISEVGIAELKQALPNCAIRR